jgi:hypothetical protein
VTDDACDYLCKAAIVVMQCLGTLPDIPRKGLGVGVPPALDHTGVCKPRALHELLYSVLSSISENKVSSEYVSKTTLTSFGSAINLLDVTEGDFTDGVDAIT